MENVNQVKAHTALMYDQVNVKGVDVSSSTDDETAKLIDRYKLLCNYNVTRNEHISSTSNCSRISSI